MTQKSSKVLILGGGYTGVLAALELSKLGIDFHLLEADKSRIGGRAFSFKHQPGGATFEHGAQYIGEEQTEIWSLAKEYTPANIVDGFVAREEFHEEITVLNNQRYLYDRTSCLFGIDGMPPNLGVWNLLAALLLVGEIQATERAINTLEPWKSPAELLALDQITVADWTSRPWIPPVARDLVTISVQALLSVDPTEISAFYFFWYCACNGGFLNEINDAQGGPQQYYLSCGFDGLLNTVVDKNGLRSKLVFDSAVKSIDLTHGPGVCVTTKSSAGVETTWTADKVIVAMSPHTYGRIAYHPAPPAGRTALMHQKMGRTVKCQVFYKSPWWRDSHQMQYSGYAGCANFPIMWVMDNSTTIEKPATYCLMTFTVASFADKLGPNPTKAAVEKLVTETLSFLFNDQRALSTSDQFLDLTFYDWNEQDKTAGGGPNTVFQTGILTGENAPGQLLNEPWEDKVFFASSETSKKLNPTSTSPYWQPSASDPVNGQYSDMRQSLGYVDGAIVSGKYVASQVAASLGKGPGPVAPPAGGPGPTLPPPAGPVAAGTFTRTQIAAVAQSFCEQFYAASGLDIAAWEASKWATYPQAMMPWLQNVVGQALAASGIDPTLANMEGVVGAAYGYSIEDTSKVTPASEQDLSTSIKKLTAIFESLVVLKSAEPFIPSGG